MSQIPQVRIKDGKLTGEIEFEHWAIANSPRWHYAMFMCKHNQWSREQAIYWLAYDHTVELEKVRKRIWELEQIAPKRIKSPDGREWVWHCSDELIPLDEPIQYR